MTNENNLISENELELKGYKDWMNQKRISENESFEISRLIADLEFLTFRVNKLEEEIRQIKNHL